MDVVGIEWVLSFVLRCADIALKRRLQQHNFLIQGALEVSFFIARIRQHFVELYHSAEIGLAGVDLFYAALLVK